MSTRRELTRAATVREIQDTALALMREHGTPELRFTDIARAMQMSPPALYRYFADRDALLTALIADSYDHLGACLAQARTTVEDAPGDRLRAGCAAYRRWATEETHRFSLVFGAPVPGYAAPEEGPTTEAAQRAMDHFKVLVQEAAAAGTLQPPRVAEAPPCLCPGGREPAGDDMAPAVFQGMLQGWSVLHGFVMLEAYGHLHWIDADARDELFEGVVELVGSAVGIPYRRAGAPA